MKSIHGIEFRDGSKEELLPDFEPDFPYIASYCELDKYPGRVAPWHWHKEIELFYIENGILEYYTPQGKTAFPKGSGGLVNANILHMTRPGDGVENTIQLLHLFDPVLLGGQLGSRIQEKYITPLLTFPQLEVLALHPDYPEQGEILELLRLSFKLSPQDYAYEMRLRAGLSDIWCRMLLLTKSLPKEKESYNKTNEKLKSMMVYIHEHYMEKLSVKEIAAAAFISERECFRAFHDCLHMTPVEYSKTYRLQKACDMLAKTQEPITSVCHACGLGSSSYFGKVFRDHTGYTPSEYRRRWQYTDINGRK